MDGLPAFTEDAPAAAPGAQPPAAASTGPLHPELAEIRSRFRARQDQMLAAGLTKYQANRVASVCYNHEMSKFALRHGEADPAEAEDLIAAAEPEYRLALQQAWAEVTAMRRAAGPAGEPEIGL